MILHEIAVVLISENQTAERIFQTSTEHPKDLVSYRQLVCSAVWLVCFVGPSRVYRLRREQ